jgi:two-component system OmpR family sensor kinase
VEVHALSAAINDLIDRQREQIERERAFLADSSHVLRTPLAVLRGNVDLLDDGSGDPERREALAHVRAALESMARTVGGLLLLARDEDAVTGDWRIVDLTRLVEDAVQEARARNSAVTLELEPGPVVEVSGDPHQLRDVVAELIENATRYTPAGGRITARTLVAPGGKAVIEIEDTGIGLSAEEAARARDRFFRGYRARLLFPSGTGLGLAIAERIASLHRGELTLTSRPAGTLVRLILPRFEGDPETS